jgi:hypothetical protein
MKDLTQTTVTDIFIGARSKTSSPLTERMSFALPAVGLFFFNISTQAVINYG